MLKNLSMRNKTLVGVAPTLLLLLFIAGVALFQVSRLANTSKWVDHTNVVLREADQIIGDALNMETGLRGYLLAGRDEFLDPYRDGEVAAFEMLASLQQTVSDNPPQVARLKEVEAILREWQRDSAAVEIELRASIGDARTMNDLVALFRQDSGKANFDKFRGQIAVFVEREEVLLTKRQEDLEAALSSGGASDSEIRAALEWTNHTYRVLLMAQNLLAAAVDMETGFRGYLLVGDPAFLEPFENGRAAFAAVATEAAKTVADNPAQVELIGEMRAVIEGLVVDIFEPMIALRTVIGDAPTMDDMADLVGEARGKAYFDQFRKMMGDFAAIEEQLMAARKVENESTLWWTFALVIAGTALALALGVGLALAVGRAVGLPITETTSSMRALADGNTDVKIFGAERRDEIGEMAKALDVFRDAVRSRGLDAERTRERAAMMSELQAALRVVVSAGAAGDFSKRVSEKFADSDLNEIGDGLNRLVASVETGVAETARVMGRLAEGDLTERMRGHFEGAFADLQRDVEATVERLREVVSEIAGVSGDIASATEEIASSARQVSSRAEQQAAALEETSATMEQMAASIASSADNAQRAAGLAHDTETRAGEGRKLADASETAMKRIAEGSSRIADITALIDSIAFQTNL
ncbi:CHASE3 domain-containing protein, partial [Rubrimonas sp.]|uniref:CHASE3 domain-containing protein n=1 Tax=Rubrimonas sp. TaxID=2036015 RepID=UPI002FDE3A47